MELSPAAVASVASSHATDTPVELDPIPLPIARNSTRRTDHLHHLTISDLISDEVRLVMQCLDRVSLIRFSRCSKRLVSDANSPAVWRYHPPVKIWLEVGPLSPLFECVSMSSLFPVDLAQKEVYLTSRRRLLQLFSISNVVTLHLPLFDFDKGEWQQIGQYQLAQSLTRLTRSIATVTTGDVLRYCPHLTSLLLDLDSNTDSLGDEAATHLSQLRRLQFVDRGSSKPTKFMRSVLFCTNLTHLEISTPSCGGTAFVEVFTNPSMRNLQFLRLDYLELPRSNARGVFESLPHLRILMLDSPQFKNLNDVVREFLLSIAVGPSLEYFALKRHATRPPDRLSDGLIRTSLRQLLADAPQLHISLHLSVENIEGRAECVSLDGHPRFLLTHAVFTEFLNDAKDQFRWPNK